MNKFLFITHITPVSKRSVFRQKLIDIYFDALRAQTYADWTVLVLGEEEKVEGKFHYFQLKDGTREEKFEAIKKLLIRKEVMALFSNADYVIKLDDDDLISPVLLEQLKNFKGDLFFDRYHTFVDSSSGIITQQRREWIASTCVHKKEHVLATWNGPGASPVGNLLYTDHSKAWHLYYEGKKCVQADPNSPVYLRVLSPTSITSGAINGPPQIISDVSIDNYYKYLKSFGNWSPVNIVLFDSYLAAVSKAWRDFSGADPKPLPEKYFENNSKRFLDKLKNFLPKKNKK